MAKIPFTKKPIDFEAHPTPWGRTATAEQIVTDIQAAMKAFFDPNPLPDGEDIIEGEKGD